MRAVILALRKAGGCVMACLETLLAYDTGRLEAYQDCLSIAKDFTGQGALIADLIRKRIERMK